MDRRTALVAGVAIGGAPSLVSAYQRRPSPALLKDRLDLPVGLRSGDVTTDSAVLWGASTGEGRLHVRLESNGRVVRSVRGAWTDARSDYTARHTLRGLAPGREYDATMWFTAPDGTRSRAHRLRFATAPIHPRATSFVWSGDTCGQGWGINPDLGGLVGYRAMLDCRPDFFLHCGDNIYGDEPMEERKEEYDGTVWRNVVTPEVAKVSETLDEFRGRYRYLLMDENVRRFHEAVPTIAQWDDHESVNNWWPGGLTEDERYTERRCDVLAARGRRAFQEYMPIALDHLNRRGMTGFAERRIYRKVARGAHLDVFCLDMRSYRGPNDVPLGEYEKGILGPTQTDWLIRSVVESRATWKVVSADQPLAVASRFVDNRDGPANGDHGAPLGREDEIARILTAFQRHGVKNVVWLTADVHYTAAHHYAPERAAYTDFDPFWEFVSGPIAASTFSPKEPDRTFGAEQVFAQGNDEDKSQSPRWGNQFFGQVLIDDDGAFTVRLRDIRGRVLWSTVLEPERPART